MASQRSPSTARDLRGQDMAPGSLFRSRVLAFLPPKLKLEAALISEHWYHAAADPEVWSRSYTAHPVLSETVSPVVEITDGAVGVFGGNGGATTSNALQQPTGRGSGRGGRGGRGGAARGGGGAGGGAGGAGGGGAGGGTATTTAAAASAIRTQPIDRRVVAVDAFHSDDALGDYALSLLEGSHRSGRGVSSPFGFDTTPVYRFPSPVMYYATLRIVSDKTVDLPHAPPMGRFEVPTVPTHFLTDDRQEFPSFVLKPKPGEASNGGDDHPASTRNTRQLQNRAAEYYANQATAAGQLSPEFAAVHKSEGRSGGGGRMTGDNGALRTPSSGPQSNPPTPAVRPQPSRDDDDDDDDVPTPATTQQIDGMRNRAVAIFRANTIGVWNFSAPLPAVMAHSGKITRAGGNAAASGRSAAATAPNVASPTTPPPPAVDAAANSATAPPMPTGPTPATSSALPVASAPTVSIQSQAQTQPQSGQAQSQNQNQLSGKAPNAASRSRAAPAASLFDDTDRGTPEEIKRVFLTLKQSHIDLFTQRIWTNDLVISHVTLSGMLCNTMRHPGVPHSRFYSCFGQIFGVLSQPPPASLNNAIAFFNPSSISKPENAAIAAAQCKQFKKQLPLAFVLLHHPRFIALSAPPEARPQMGTLRPVYTICAFLAHMHLTQPQRRNVPWLAAIAGHWALNCIDPTTGDFLAFHKSLILPLLALISTGGAAVAASKRTETPPGASEVAGGTSLHATPQHVPQSSTEEPPRIHHDDGADGGSDGGVGAVGGKPSMQGPGSVADGGSVGAAAARDVRFRLDRMRHFEVCLEAAIACAEHFTRPLREMEAKRIQRRRSRRASSGSAAGSPTGPVPFDAGASSRRSESDVGDGAADDRPRPLDDDDDEAEGLPNRRTTNGERASDVRDPDDAQDSELAGIMKGGAASNAIVELSPLPRLGSLLKSPTVNSSFGTGSATNPNPSSNRNRSLSPQGGLAASVRSASPSMGRTVSFLDDPLGTKLSPRGAAFFSANPNAQQPSTAPRADRNIEASKRVSGDANVGEGGHFKQSHDDDDDPPYLHSTARAAATNDGLTDDVIPYVAEVDTPPPLVRRDTDLPSTAPREVGGRGDADAAATVTPMLLTPPSAPRTVEPTPAVTPAVGPHPGSPFRTTSTLRLGSPVVGPRGGDDLRNRSEMDAVPVDVTTVQSERRHSVQGGEAKDLTDETRQASVLDEFDRIVSGDGSGAAPSLLRGGPRGGPRGSTRSPFGELKTPPRNPLEKVTSTPSTVSTSSVVPPPPQLPQPDGRAKNGAGRGNGDGPMAGVGTPPPALVPLSPVKPMTASDPSGTPAAHEPRRYDYYHRSDRQDAPSPSDFVVSQGNESFGTAGGERTTRPDTTEGYDQEAPTVRTTRYADPTFLNDQRNQAGPGDTSCRADGDGLRQSPISFGSPGALSLSSPAQDSVPPFGTTAFASPAVTTTRQPQTPMSDSQLATPNTEGLNPLTVFGATSGDGPGRGGVSQPTRRTANQQSSEATISLPLSHSALPVDQVSHATVEKPFTQQLLSASSSSSRPPAPSIAGPDDGEGQQHRPSTPEVALLMHKRSLQRDMATACGATAARKTNAADDDEDDATSLPLQPPPASRSLGATPSNDNEDPPTAPVGLPKAPPAMSTSAAVPIVPPPPPGSVMSAASASVASDGRLSPRNNTGTGRGRGGGVTASSGQKADADSASRQPTVLMPNRRGAPTAQGTSRRGEPPTPSLLENTDPDHPVLLPDTDPRLCFSPLAQMQRTFQRMSGDVEERVRRVMGAYGVVQLAAARRRLEFLDALQPENPAMPRDGFT